MKNFRNGQTSDIQKPSLLHCQTKQGTLFFVAHNNGTPALPGNGGTRIKMYASPEDAARECQGLSAVMTHKHAVYNTGFTGAKLVVVADPARLDKAELLDTMGGVLNFLGGSVYTGCDMNTTLEDMEYLLRRTPYVLASLGSAIDPNVATAYGVYGGLLSLCMGRLYGKRFLVHGTGNVGATLAALLAGAGAEVFTYDLVPERAEIPGCRNMSDRTDWWNIPCNVLVPCSHSGLVTETIARRLECDWIAGSANIPFGTAAVPGILASRDISYIPEAITSAGAILCDSVEHYNRETFLQAAPADMYAYVQGLVAEKTAEFIDVLRLDACSELEALGCVFTDPLQAPCGTRFHELAGTGVPVLV